MNANRFPAAALFLAGASALHAQIVYTSGTLNTAIPDDSVAGLAHVIQVPDSYAIAEVVVSLNLSVPSGETGWAGDLYAYVQHGSGLAVLLNRPGLAPANPAGYSDSRSFSIRFSDTAVNGDVRSYRSVVTGNETTPLSGPLTGAWQPDGRATDPDLVTASDPRTAMLAAFNGGNVTGGWTVFLADMAEGNRYRLDSWSVSVTAVPEPETAAVAAGLALAGWSVARRMKKRA
jgi:subtilisin-like proprotein convertase family protein